MSGNREQRAELVALATRSRSAGPRRPSIARQDLSGPFRLSFAQEQLWFMWQLEPESARWNIVLTWQLRGELDIAALAEALTQVVADHEALRTRFAEVGGEPRQVIEDAAPFPLSAEELAGAEATREAVLADLMREESLRPFDLAVSPLLRVRLWRLEPGLHVLMLTVHHIAADDQSLQIIARDLAGHYLTGVSGQAVRSAAPPLRYGDYALWQRDSTPKPVLDRQLAYWTAELAGAPTTLGIQPDCPLRPGLRHAVGVAEFEVDAETAGRLGRLGQAAGATQNMVFLAAFAAWLARYGGQADVIVGVPSADRPVAELASVVGMFVTLLPIRCRVGKGDSFSTLVQRVKAASLGAYAHRSAPFEAIVERLGPAREPGRYPLFDAILAVSQQDRKPLELPGLDVRQLVPVAQLAPPGVNLIMKATGAGWTGTLTYSRDLFADDRLQRMTETFSRWLTAFADRQDRPLWEVAEPSRVDLSEALALAEDRPAEVPAEPVHLTVLARAGGSPDAVAVIDAETRLTYGQLARQADELAARLDLGPRPGEPVIAVQLPRGAKLAVALLAAMRAGGVYLPIDPDQPLLRRQAILTDAGPQAVVTKDRWLAGLADLRARTVCLDAGAAAPPADGPWPTVVSGDQLAYAIYTSGSTGRPKGALNTHRGIANLLGRLQERHHLGPGDAMLCHTAPSFDVSVLEMLWPLLAGGTAVFARPGGQTDFSYLADLIDRHQVTAVIVVPAVLASFLDLPEVSRRCASLRVIVCGGEALTARLRDRCLDALPNARLDNCYGPAEAAVGATLWACRPEDRSHSVPIGRPMTFNRAYLCDDDRRPVPLGAVGELCLSGDNVGRGYLTRPDLTADRYVPDPFSPVPGTRMYRTGDLARIGGRGALEFAGRVDRQVKLRGVRLELEEIEAVLAAHPNVREVAVVVRSTGRDDDQLVAYVAPYDAWAAPDLNRELRAQARDRLPAAAVPGAFVVIDKLPRTTHGKPDLTALPAPATDPGSTPNGLPRTRLELELIRIWERVIGTHPIGIEDDFFDLGGHSLLAVRLLSAVADRLGVRLPGDSIFTHRTIAGQAALLDASSVRLSANLPPCLIRMNEGARGQPLFIVHPIGGSAFCYTELSRGLAAEAPVYCIQAAGLVPGQPPQETVPAMATAYLQQVRTLCPAGPLRLAGWSFGGLIAYEMASQCAAAGGEIGLLALIDPSPILGDAEFTPGATANDLTVLRALLEFAGRLSGLDLLAGQDLAAFRPDQCRAEVMARLRRATGIGASGSDELERLIDVFSANWRAYRRYRPTPYPDGMTLIAADGASTDVEKWQALVPSGLRVISMPYGHFDLISPPHVSEVVAELAADLAGGRRDESPARPGNRP